MPKISYATESSMVNKPKKVEPKKVQPKKVQPKKNKKKGPKTGFCAPGPDPCTEFVNAPAPDDFFNFNWWEVCCFPYVVCGKIWECCMTLCKNTNQCLVYWIVLQWIICKLSKKVTPHPFIFTYYFYMVLQVLLVTLFFVMFWYWFGPTVLVPIYKQVRDIWWDNSTLPRKRRSRKNKQNQMFRRFCFRKGEIFSSSDKIESLAYKDTPVLYVVFSFIDIFILDLL